MSKTSQAEFLVIGGEPRVNLLPREVHRERKAKVVRRRLGLAVVAALLLIVAGSGAATVLSIQSQADLLTEQARTTDLLSQQSKYIEVRKVQDHVDLIAAAQQVGVSTEIDWKAYLQGVQDILPASVTIDTVTVDSASPLAIYGQPTAPLQGARVATVSFTAKSAVLPDVPTWLTSLATLPGFADALPSSADLDIATNTYTVNITMHINDAAFAQRFTAASTGGK
jgi:hypothetical protein